MRAVAAGLGLFTLLGLQRIVKDLPALMGRSFLMLMVGVSLILVAQILLVVACLVPGRLIPVVVVLTVAGLVCVALGQPGLLPEAFWRIDAWTVTTFIYLVLFRRRGVLLPLLIVTSVGGFVWLALRMPMNWTDQLLAITFTFASPMVLALGSQVVSTALEQFLASQRIREQTLSANAASTRHQQNLAYMRRVTHDTVLHCLQLIASTWARMSPAEIRETAAGALAGLSRAPGQVLSPDATTLDEHLKRELDTEPCRITWHGSAEALPQIITEKITSATREAIRNVVKHCAVPEADVSLHTTFAVTEVTIEDSGPGFDAEVLSPGLTGIRESIVNRMAAIGGHAGVHSTPAGTTVTLSWPAYGGGREDDPLGRHARGWLTLTPIPLVVASIPNALLYHNGLSLPAAILIWAGLAALVLLTARSVRAGGMSEVKAWSLTVAALAATAANMWWIDASTTNGWSLWVPSLTCSLIILALPTQPIWHAVAMGLFFATGSTAASVLFLGLDHTFRTHDGALLAVYSHTALTLLLSIAITAIRSYTIKTRQIEESARLQALNSVERETMWRAWTTHTSSLVGTFLTGVADGSLDRSSETVRAEARFLEARLRDDSLLWPGDTGVAAELDRLRRGGRHCRLFVENPSAAELEQLARLLRRLGSQGTGELSVSDADRTLTVTFSDPPLGEAESSAIAQWLSISDEDFTQAQIPREAG